MRTLSTLAAMALLMAPSFAQEQEIDCENAMAQQDMNYCAYREFEAADIELNRVWQKARAAAKEADREYSEDLKGEEKALLAAQRGWIAYRDGECELAGFEARGGSMEPMVVRGCLAEMTRKRTAELQQFIDGP